LLLTDDYDAFVPAKHTVSIDCQSMDNMALSEYS